MPEQWPRVRAARAAETVLGDARLAQWCAPYCDAAYADAAATVRLYSVARFKTCMCV